jgi:DNA-binding transcriptional LysR family regulator
LPQLLGEFTHRHPGVKTVLHITDSRQTLEELLARNIDVGIVGAKIQKPSLNFTPLLDDEQIVIAPSKHRWKETETIDLAELCREPFVIRESGSGSRMELGRHLQQAGISTESLNIAAELGSATAVKQAVKAGMGVALISERAVGEELESKLLKRVTIRNMTFKRSFYLVQDSRRTPSPLIEAFVEYIKTELQ